MRISRDQHDFMAASGATTHPPSGVRARVTDRRVEAEGVFSVDLAVPAASLPEQPSPGAHVDLLLPNGLVRQYSLVRWTPKSLVIAVKLEANGRGGSECLSRVQPGDEIMLGAVRNAFALHPGTHESVLVAGGIGITPFVSMAERLATEGRRWTLYYAARSASHAPYAEELMRFGGHVRFSFHEGRFDLRAIVRAHAPNAHFYACGPAPLLDGFRAATAGLPSSQIHQEHFAPVGPGADAQSFVLELARSGIRVEVPSDRTVLQALRESGVEIGYSCEQGICGQCEVTVLAGVPDHRDQILSDQERASGKSLMACCSRSLSKTLVLDC